MTETITRLVEGQILNDSALASHLANHYSAGGHRSRKQIWALLKTKQLSDPDIRSALDQLD
ncbi:TPA: hypothetical protein DHW58_02350, partial [Patescibacteria group bacterium]|nr:hypothetical protein [Patescibacteria group bacterium]